MALRDLRRQLRGRFLEGCGELTTRDVGRDAHCEGCGDKLDIHTEPMTGQTVEDCPRCGTSQPVQRFLAVEDDGDVEPPNQITV